MLPPALDDEFVNRLLFSFCDDSRVDIRFKAAISLELYSSVEELLDDTCDPNVLGFRDCNGTRPE